MMRGVIIGAAFFVLAVAAIRRFGPSFRDWAMAKCRQMFDRMSDEPSPERVLRDFEEQRTALPAE